MPTPMLTPTTLKHDRAWWLALLALALFTRFYQLGAESLWLDEGITFDRSGLDIHALIADATSHYHNPFYFLIVHFFMKLGDDEFMLRAPSAVFGVLKIAAVYVLGRNAWDQRAGLFAGLLVLLVPSQLQYDQEARMYALYVFGSSTALAGLVWLAAHPREAALASWKAEARAARPAWFAFVLGSVLALYSHDTAVLFVTACSLCALVLLALPAGGDRRGFLVNWVLANLLVIAAFSLWLPSLLAQTKTIQHRGFWMYDMSAGHTHATLQAGLTFGRSAIARVLTWLTFGAALWGTWTLRDKPRVAATLWVLQAAGPGLLYAVSTRHPMFEPRLLIWSVVPGCALAAIGFAALRPSWLPAAAAAGVLVLGGINLQSSYYAPSLKTRWREIAQTLSDNYTRDTAVLAVGGQEKRLLEYYFNRKTHPLKRVPCEYRLPVIDATLEALIDRKTTVWLVQAHRSGTAGPVRKQLRARGRLEFHGDYGWSVMLEKYRLRARRRLARN